MRSQFQRVRFILFIHSSTGYRISTYIKQAKDVHHAIQLTAKALLFSQNLLRCFILHKSCLRKYPKSLLNRLPNKKEVLIFLLIEKELLFLLNVREEKDNFLSDDYEEHGLLSPAIERVAGNDLKNIQNDHEFEERLDELIGKYRYVYYSVAYKYKIPTLRIVPFILRLITE